MNPSLRSAWTSALRSGKYLQGRGSLRSPDGRLCAMGVLYDLIARSWGRDHEPMGAFLTQDMLARIGLSNSTQLNIARLNDNGMSFEAIADLIDRDADMETEIQAEVDKTLRKISATVYASATPTGDIKIPGSDSYSWYTFNGPQAVALQQAMDHAKVINSISACFGLWA